MSSHQVLASFRLGTSRDVAPCSAPPDKHPPTRSSDVCFPNSRLRVPVLARSRCVHATCAACGAMGFGTHRVAGGGDAHAASWSPLRRTAFTPDSGLPTGSGMFSTDAAHAANLCHPCRFSRSGCRWTTFHAFAWVLPGESRQDRFYRLRVNSDGFPDQGQLPSMRGLFAWAELTPRLDTDALRAASGI